MKILIATASRYGSTEEIAERIATVFRDGSAETEVRPAYEVEDLSEYDAVVLGTPLYNGKPLAGAIGFAKRLPVDLSEMPTAFFVVGLGLAHPTEKIIRKVVKATKDIITHLHPKDVGLFAGSLDYANVNWFVRLVMKLMKIPEGDFRKWDVIERWAQDVLPQLTQEAPQA